MNVIKAQDYAHMSILASDLIIEEIEKSAYFKLGLATGSSPVGLYKELIEAYKKGTLSFENVTSFNLDEYVGLKSDDPNSYHYFMQQHLFNHVNIQKHKTFIPNGMANDLQEECRRYEALIEEEKGIDLQILGIGENGHIGFNEPSTPFTEKTHVVSLDESTREANARFFNSKENVPTQAITVGIHTIMKSKKILLLISGESKKEAYERLMDPHISTYFPASILHEHPDCTVIVDTETVMG
jgi:glucosamine-6-phosphate deaminase